ncbi:ATP-binding cassette domain-containing protein [Bacillus hominis]|uniref:ABC transporter ATP-binding protein n=1 Tax=Bacillus cereus group TaxID=86661 RepID=UPI0025A15016|nr:ABC transporter transmembrane domain-containing protein [Bacillus hominis]MDM5436492.1 ATP-binding cassette domain-containing protein [Bacillus hominis]
MKSLISFFSFVGRKLKQDKKIITMIFLSLCVHSVLVILTPWLTMKMIDYVLPQNDRNVFWWLLFGIVFTPILAGLLRTFEDYNSNKLGHNVVTRLRVEIFESYLQTKLSAISKKMGGEYIQRIVQDCEQVAHWIYITASRLVLNLLQLVIIFYLLWSLNSELGYLSLSLLLLYFVPYLVFASKFLSASSQVMKEREGAMGLLNEGINAVYTIKSMGIQEYAINRYDNKNQDYLKAFLNFTKVHQMTEFTIGVIVALGIGLVYLYSGYKVLHGELTIGVLIAAKMYIESMFTSARNLFIRVVETMEKVPVAEKLQHDESDILNHEVIQGNSVGKINSIQIKDLSFSYKDKQIIKNLSINIPVGKHIAVVGKSGCGKSTLLKFLLRLYEFEGAIKINGKPIQDYNLEVLRREIVLVPQHPELINGTVWENIIFDLSEVQKDEIKEMLQDLRVDEFVSQLPEQYNTNIGKYSNQSLSGGQLQRLAIARALIRNPQVLLLDESTSALDKENTKIVLQAIRKHMKGKTVILVTHNEQVATQVEEVIYIESLDKVHMSTHELFLKKHINYQKHFILNENKH